ncbi:MAG: hypothetical protein SPE13_00095, partial [Alloprevotella sp.]|nr:hypothetical protein [Alloprevotella sp.]
HRRLQSASRLDHGRSRGKGSEGIGGQKESPTPGKLQTTLLRKVMTWRLIAIFFATVIFFINLSGCVFNALS